MAPQVRREGGLSTPPSPWKKNELYRRQVYRREDKISLIVLVREGRRDDFEPPLREF